MNSNFIPQAVDIVKQAIEADNAGELEKALPLYQRALDYFVTGLKYEQNPAAKKMVQEKVFGYMQRAEEIKKALSEQNAPPKDSKSGTGSTKTLNKDDKTAKDDDEKSKLRGALSSAIVAEKPNIKWDDVAGLEGAKEALKEAVILPVRFPQVIVKQKELDISFFNLLIFFLLSLSHSFVFFFPSFLSFFLLLRL
jgi:vacuolar protein-sorting-associated protein 4